MQHKRKGMPSGKKLEQGSCSEKQAQLEAGLSISNEKCLSSSAR